MDLTRQACNAAHENGPYTPQDASAGAWHRVVIDLDTGDEQCEYSVYNEKDDPFVEVCSVAYTDVGDLTDEAARLIHEEMCESAGRHGGVVYDVGEVKGARVEVFTRRAFFVQLDSGDISIRTDFGYTVDDMEVRIATSRIVLDDPGAEGRSERMFGKDDVQEFARALVETGLVDEADKARLLGRF